MDVGLLTSAYAVSASTARTESIDLSVGSVAEVVVAILVSVVGVWLALWQDRRTRRGQREARQAAQQVAKQVGADADLARVVTGDGVEIVLADSGEVTRRVDEAMLELAGMAERLTAHETAADQLRKRLRSVEDKFPEASEFQKYADSNQLFLAYQLGEITKRLERLEQGQLTRFQVIGIVIATLVAAVGVAGGAGGAGGAVALLQAVHLLH